MRLMDDTHGRLAQLIDEHQPTAMRGVCGCGRGVLTHGDHLAEVILISGLVVSAATVADDDEEDVP